MIWAIILAAGESKRMAQAKLLLSYAGKTIIETVVSQTLASSVDDTLVVLGAYRARISKKLKNMPVRTVVNSQYNRGMLSSVQLGFRTLPKTTQAAVILLGDQPSISSQIIDDLIQGYERSGRGIVLPTCKGERGHPVLIDLKFKAEIERLAPDVGLRGVVYSHPEDIYEVSVDDPGILKDIDTLDDYRRDLKSLKV